MLAIERPRTGTAAESGPLTVPRILANRRRIDDRFPVLGFTVDAGSRAYFEVVLTTDRRLFDPRSAGRRTPANFYSSRQDSGLIRSDGAASIYLVPATVLRSFNGAREIFYTALAYEAADGRRPILALPPETLVTAAPSVSVAPGFRGRTVARVLGVPLERLRRLRDEDGPGPAVEAPAAPREEIDAEVDRAEGEDGFGLAAPDGEATFREVTAEDAFQAKPRVEEASGDDDYDDLFEDPIQNPEAVKDEVKDEAEAPLQSSEPYGDEADEVPELPSAAAESRFPEGFPAPAMLEDEDDADEDGAAGADEFEPTEFEGLEAPATAASPVPLTIQEKRRIIEQVAPFESGREGYAAINADGEYGGRFGTDHPAHRRYHVGLSYGIVQFTQDSGTLGRLLTLMRDRDPGRFREIFGDDSDALLRVTNATGPRSSASPGGRSARVQPVGGADLWTEPWLSRFRRAADHIPFQAAQNELAATLYLEPVLRFAGWLGLDTDRALAMLYDRSVQMGVGGARRWTIEAVGPVQTAAQRQQALGALGHADLRAFQRQVQRASPDFASDGEWGPLTHAAMVAALRGIGGRSPVPIPTRDQMMDAMVRRARGARWAHRVERLRGSSQFTDVVYQL